jgi:hypothetical protein
MMVMRVGLVSDSAALAGWPFDLLYSPLPFCFFFPLFIPPNPPGSADKKRFQINAPTLP